MIIYYDTFNNMIRMSREADKKQEAYYFEKEFDFSLLDNENKVKATTLFLALPETKEAANDKSNLLIFSDDVIGYGMFTFPNLKRQKMDDVFVTRFRVCFPNDASYFYEGDEVGRNENHIFYHFRFAKRELVGKIVTMYKNNNIIINSRNIFASLFTVSEKGVAPYPIPVLVMGKKSIELIIVKGKSVISTNIFEYGVETLLDSSTYLNSGYSHDNEDSVKFATLIKNHIATREEVNDTNIDKADPKESLSFNNPKELRLLREGKLQQYIIRNNFRKFYARLLEIIETYEKEPWFFPLKEIGVIGCGEVLSYLVECSGEDNIIRFVAINDDVSNVFTKRSDNDPLLSQGVKKERRKIDWKALLNTEIGGKKKKD